MIYLPGDFNINLFQNSEYIKNRKISTTSQGLVHTITNRYKEFCQIHSLKQLINVLHVHHATPPLLLTALSQILLKRSFNPVSFTLEFLIPS